MNIGMKRIRSLLMVTTLLILIGAMISVGSTSDSTRLYVDPPRTTARAGYTFTVDIMIEDVVDLFTWQVYMYWDSSALTCNNVYFGDFMDQPREGSAISSDAASGQYDVYVAGYIGRFHAGESVLIYDDSNSETNIISSILGYKLTMSAPLANTYTVAAHGQVDTMPGTSTSKNIKTGSVMTGEMTSLPSAGVSGSGWLATIEFQVLSETETVLNMSAGYPSYTYLLDSMGFDIECTVEDGRYVPPPPEDLNFDGMIDIFDLCQCGIHYGETGTPGWIPEDFTGPTPYEPDGIVELYDLSAIVLKYGSV